MATCFMCPSSSLNVADRNVVDFEYGAPGSYTYLRCETCGTLHIDPMPDDATLAKAYPATYHAYLEQPTALARRLKARYWRKKAKRSAKLVSRNAAVLDAGCANGDFLLAMRDLGFADLTGLDFNADAVARAKRHKFNVIQGDLDAAGLEPNRFDLIVMTNFIEHVTDPVAVLRRCGELLRPGGIILGETPNVASWDYALFRREWGGYHTPRHLCLFDTHNLRMLAERAGFEVRSISNMLQPAHWALSVQNALKAARDGLTIRNGRSRLFTPMLLLSLPINLIQMAVSRTSLVEFVFAMPAADGPTDPVTEDV